MSELGAEHGKHVAIRVDRDHTRTCAQQSARQRAKPWPKLDDAFVLRRCDRGYDALDGAFRDQEVLREAAFGRQAMTSEHAARIFPGRQVSHATLAPP